MSPAPACCFRRRSRRPTRSMAIGILSALEGVPRPAPAIAPFAAPRSDGLKRSSRRRAPRSRGRAGQAASAARRRRGRASTSRATASAASRLRGARPGRGRDRKAASPSRATAPRQRRTCSARTPRRGPDRRAGLAGERPEHGARPVRLGARPRAAQPLQRGPSRLVHHQSASPPIAPSRLFTAQRQIGFVRVLNRV